MSLITEWSSQTFKKKKKKDNFSDCNIFEAAGKSSHVDAPISSLPTVCRRKSLSMEKSHWSVKVNTIYCTWPPCWGHRGPRQQLWLVVLVLNSSETSLCLRLTFYHSSSPSVKTFSTYSRFHSVTSSVANIYCRSVLTSVLWMEDVFRSSGPLGDLWSSPPELSILTDSSTDAACLLHVLYVCRF